MIIKMQNKLQTRVMYLSAEHDMRVFNLIEEGLRHPVRRLLHGPHVGIRPTQSEHRIQLLHRGARIGSNMLRYVWAL